MTYSQLYKKKIIHAGFSQCLFQHIHTYTIILNHNKQAHTSRTTQTNPNTLHYHSIIASLTN